eukprot:TRINITY_DN3208_c0_g1_i3.p1 TRINITY_DN3208_c0_g1~~TRINITY_DN3208_c0_g1_i3.p1  ORF type:complete len:272 (+),score=146.20 TRINITY_DN3208_c0_g1_i3:262-1077(+)
MNNAKEKERIVVKLTEHKDQEVTSLLWIDDNNNTTNTNTNTTTNTSQSLFSADSAGSIYLTSLSKIKSLFFSAEFIYKCDSKVVQLDYFSNTLLASSLTTSLSLTFNNNNNTKPVVVKIGKAAREGIYGACFYTPLEAEQNPTPNQTPTPTPPTPTPPTPLNQKLLFASRPGKRLWLADSQTGKVLNTLNFQSSFLKPPSPLLPDSLSGDNLDGFIASLLLSPPSPSSLSSLSPLPPPSLSLSPSSPSPLSAISQSTKFFLFADSNPIRRF